MKLDTAKIDTAKISLGNIHTYFVRQLESWVDGLPDKERDKPFVGAAGSDAVELTPKQMLDHVRQLTPLGVELFENAAALRMTAKTRKMSGVAMKKAPRPTKRVFKAAAKAWKRATPRARTAPRSAKPR